MYSKKVLSINAICVIILVMSAFIGQSQGQRRFNLKDGEFDSYDTDDKSSDSKEDDTGLQLEHLNLSLNHTKISSSKETTKVSLKNKKVRKDDEYLTKEDDSSRENDKIIRGNPKNLFNEGVTSKLKSSTAESTLLNAKNASNQKEGIILGGPKSNSNEHVKSTHTQKSSEEDEVIRGNLNTESDERALSKQENLEAHTHSKSEDTNESSKEDNPKSESDERVPLEHENLSGKSNQNLKDTIESVEEKRKIKNDNKTKLNKSKDELVFGKGKRNESNDNKVSPSQSTDQHKLTKDPKPISKQWTPSMVIRAVENPASNGSSSEDEVMLRDIRRAKALRKAYGDACVRVTVKKCLNAMKKTLKEICKENDRRCKKEFNEEFRESAIAGCYMQFSNKSTFRIGNEDPMGEESRDNTRQLSMTCMRALGNSTEDTGSLKHDAGDAKTKKVNILRDRYERACQKENFKKCKRAGKYARETTCGKQECTKLKKKAIKETCKKHCRFAFKYLKRGDSDSGSQQDSD